MAKIRFENGTVVNFEGTPTPEDVEEVARQHNIQPTRQNQQPTTPITQTTTGDDEGGFLSNLARDVTKPAVTLAARPVQAGIAAFGGDKEAQKFDLPFFGEIGTVESGKDVVRDVGRGFETAALGIGGGAAAKTALSSLKGLGLQALRQGFLGGLKGGALGGAGRQIADTGEPSIAGTGAAAVSGGLIGGATGGALGGVGGALGAGAQKGFQSFARSRAGGVLGDLQRNQQIQDALDIVRPTRSRSEAISQIERGRGQNIERRGLFGTRARIQPSNRDRDVAESVAGVVRKGAREEQNIASISDEIGRLDDQLQREISRNNAIFNKKELRSHLNQIKEENRVIFGGDKTLENNYNAVMDELFKQIDKNNLSGLFQARKDLDRIIRQKFPRTFTGDASDNVRRNALLDVRRGVNDFIAEKLPEGNQLKPTLQQESRMFEAIENLSENLYDKTKDSQVVRRLLESAGIGLGTSAGIGVLSSLGLPPFRQSPQ